LTECKDKEELKLFLEKKYNKMFLVDKKGEFESFKK